MSGVVLFEDRRGVHHAVGYSVRDAVRNLKRAMAPDLEALESLMEVEV